MSFKDMKKVHEDEKSATFKNKAGHELKIAKKGLSADRLKRLKELPLHAADGVDTSQPQDFVPGKDYSNAPLPGDQNSEPVASADQAAPTPAPPPAPEPPSAAGPQPASDNSAPQPAAPTQQPAQQQAPPTPQATKQAIVNHAVSENTAWNNDLAMGQVKPETYHDLFAKKDTLGKIGSIFGILVGGMGAGLTHQNNAALQMMDNEIKNDLDAQKATKTNAYNIAQLNYQHKFQQAQMQGMSLDNATKAAQLSWSTSAYPQTQSIVAHYLGNKVDQMPEGAGKQRATAALGLVKTDMQNRGLQSINQAADQLANDPELQFEQQKARLSDLSTGMAMFGNASASNALIEKQKFMEQHHVSGYNQPTNRPISESDRKDLNTLNTLDQSYQDASNYIKRSGVLGPLNSLGGTPLSKEGNRLSARIESEMGLLSGSNRFTAGLKDLHEERMPDLTGTHITGSDAQAVNDLRREVQQRRASILSSYGLGAPTQPQLPQSAKTSAENWLKQNPSHPMADKVKRILGQ